MGGQMKNEFKKGDILAEICGEDGWFYLVEDSESCGYFVDCFKLGERRWRSYVFASEAHDNMVKVDEWDDLLKCRKSEVEDE